MHVSTSCVATSGCLPWNMKHNTIKIFEIIFQTPLPPLSPPLCSTSHIHSSSTHSCGCLATSMAAEGKDKDQVEKIFNTKGRLLYFSQNGIPPLGIELTAKQIRVLSSSADFFEYSYELMYTKTQHLSWVSGVISRFAVQLFWSQECNSLEALRTLTSALCSRTRTCMRSLAPLSQTEWSRVLPWLSITW